MLTSKFALSQESGVQQLCSATSGNGLSRPQDSPSIRNAPDRVSSLADCLKDWRENTVRYVRNFGSTAELCSRVSEAYVPYICSALVVRFRFATPLASIWSQHHRRRIIFRST